MNNVIILSAALENLSPRDNLYRTEELQQCLEAIPAPVIAAKSCYNGKTEDSFIVTICPNFGIQDAVTLAEQFEQECILIVDSSGCASLQYTDGSAKYSILGQFTQVTEERALQEEAYIRVKGKYYAVIGDDNDVK